MATARDLRSIAMRLPGAIAGEHPLDFDKIRVAALRELVEQAYRCVARP
jgi:hypothetical protein